MTTPRDHVSTQPPGGAAAPLPGESIRDEHANWLVHLRLTARVVSDAARPRLVGDGGGVEITPDGATPIRVHNEPVSLALSHAIDVPVEDARALLRRWHALGERVHVELTTVRTGLRSPRAGRRIEITGPDGTVLRWSEPRAADTHP